MDDINWAKIKKTYCLNEKDTGSTMVQIIELEREIEKLISHRDRNKKESHLKKYNKSWKDVPARRAMLEKVAKKERLLQYLKKKNFSIWEKINKDLKENKK